MGPGPVSAGDDGQGDRLLRGGADERGDLGDGGGTVDGGLCGFDVVDHEHTVDPGSDIAEEGRPTVRPSPAPPAIG